MYTTIFNSEHIRICIHLYNLKILNIIFLSYGTEKRLTLSQNPINLFNFGVSIEQNQSNIARLKRKYGQFQIHLILLNYLYFDAKLVINYKFLLTPIF